MLHCINLLSHSLRHLAEEILHPVQHALACGFNRTLNRQDFLPQLFLVGGNDVELLKRDPAAALADVVTDSMSGSLAAITLPTCSGGLLLILRSAPGLTSTGLTVTIRPFRFRCGPGGGVSAATMRGQPWHPARAWIGSGSILACWSGCPSD